ncbi:MAG: hypothetical protein ACXVXH_14025 [Nocardioidaceae bacterium]
MRRGPLLVALATTLIVCVGGIAVGSSAAADGHELQLSSGGATWHDNLPRALFAHVGLLVPQDQVEDSFYVRNNSSVPARATIAVVAPAGTPSDLARQLTVTTHVAGMSASTPLIFGPEHRCTTFLTGPDLAPGARQRVNVGVGFHDATAGQGQAQTTRVGLVVTLSQVAPKGLVDICGIQAPVERRPGAAGCQSTRQSSVTLLGSSSVQRDCPETLPSTGAAPGLGAALAYGLVLSGLGGLIAMATGRRRRTT